jgi:prepilin-type N-terminal cleavage/methylation domain-containing protein
MKIRDASNVKQTKARHSGFSLAELLVASTIFLIFVVGAMVCVQIYGLRVYSLTSTKIKVATGAREAMNDIRDRIRSAYDCNVGNYTSSSGFTSLTNGQSQQGNAIQIFPTTNILSTAVYFYQDSANNVLNMVSNNVVSVEVNNMTNYYCFQNEDFQGNVATNNIGYRVIDIIMQFNQLAFPIGFSGGTKVNAYDYYRLRTRITRRTINAN